MWQVDQLTRLAEQFIVPHISIRRGLVNVVNNYSTSVYTLPPGQLIRGRAGYDLC